MRVVMACPCKKPHEDTGMYTVVSFQKKRHLLFMQNKTKLHSFRAMASPAYVPGIPIFKSFHGPKKSLNWALVTVEQNSIHTPLCKVLAVPRKHTLPISRKMELRIPRFCQKFFYIWIWTCVAHNGQIKTGAQPVSGTKKAKFTKKLL